MERKEQKISPAGFDLLQRELQRAELEGYGPDAAVRWALASVALYPKDFTEVVLIVDYSLDGPVWPFMDWPKGWDRNDRTTWR